MIDVTKLVSVSEYAKAHKLHRQRISKLLHDNRLQYEIVCGKKLIYKDSYILPASRAVGRPKMTKSVSLV